MNKNIISLILALMTVVSLVMVGCSSSPSPTPPPSTNHAAPPPTTSTVPETSTTAPLTTSSPTPTSPASSAPANVITLKYNDEGVSSSFRVKNATLPWLAQVTKATNGRVQFQTYFNQSLSKAADTWNATMTGLDDVGWIFHGLLPGMTPLADVIELPFLNFSSAKQASGILWQLYEKYPTMASEFKENHILILYASTPNFLVTSKKQVKTMNDIKGLKIRAPAGPPTEMLKLLGAVPMALSGTDTYQDLQKGVIDGAIFPWDALNTFRIYEVVKYYTYVPLAVAYYSVAMNNDTWSSLPKNIQDEINSVSGLEGSEFWGENQFDKSVTVTRSLIQKEGYPMVEYTVPPDEIAQWSAVAGKPVWNDWVQKMNSEGHTAAQDMLNTTLDLIKTYQP